MVEQQMKDD